MPAVLATGVDISEWNGDVDLIGMKNQVDFVIIRCGYGSDFADQDDARFFENVEKCRAAGIPYGVYLYSYAKTPAMARSEAAHTLRLLQGLRPLYGVWYDVEDPSLPAGETLIEDVALYCSLIEEAGYYCGFYASLSWMEGRLADPRLDRWDRWVAQWSDSFGYTGNAGMWQCSDSALINGGRFDLDRAFRDYPKIITEMEESTDMTKEEVALLAREEARKVWREEAYRYPTIASLPDWAREAVRGVYNELALTGTGTPADGETRLNASYDYVRALYVIARVLELLKAESAALED